MATRAPNPGCHRCGREPTGTATNRNPHVSRQDSSVQTVFHAPPKPDLNGALTHHGQRPKFVYPIICTIPNGRATKRTQRRAAAVGDIWKSADIVKASQKQQQVPTRKGHAQTGASLHSEPVEAREAVTGGCERRRGRYATRREQTKGSLTPQKGRVKPEINMQFRHKGWSQPSTSPVEGT